jgi:hypothetical protein
MGNYEMFVKGKTTEDLLAHTISSDPGPLGDYIRVAVQIRMGQDAVMAQNLSSGNVVEAIKRLVASQDNVTEHLVGCTSSLVAVQNSSVNKLIASMDGLTGSIDRASGDSGKLGRRVVVLTIGLVCVGVGQIIAMAWPYLDWWWHH